MAARPARWTTPARSVVGRADRLQRAILSDAMIQKSLLHKGCRLSYFIEGHGPPVVLVQGTAVSGGAWRPQVDALAKHFRCLWFDNRGYGKSLPLTPSLTVPQMGEDVLALMDAEELATAHLIGHSLVRLYHILETPRMGVDGETGLQHKGQCPIQRTRSACSRRQTCARVQCSVSVCGALESVRFRPDRLFCMRRFF